jgi:hypothetical protein
MNHEMQQTRDIGLKGMGFGVGLNGLGHFYPLARICCGGKAALPPSYLTWRD